MIVQADLTQADGHAERRRRSNGPPPLPRLDPPPDARGGQGLRQRRFRRRSARACVTRMSPEGPPFRHRRPDHPSRGLRPLAASAGRRSKSPSAGPRPSAHGPDRLSRRRSAVPASHSPWPPATSQGCRSSGRMRPGRPQKGRILMRTQHGPEDREAVLEGQHFSAPPGRCSSALPPTAVDRGSPRRGQQRQPQRPPHEGRVDPLARGRLLDRRAHALVQRPPPLESPRHRLDIALSTLATVPTTRRPDH